MSKVKFVIFDMDGLLFNTENVGYEAMRRAFADHEVDFPERYYIESIGMRIEETTANLIRRYGEEFPLDAMFEKYFTYFEELIASGMLQTKPGTSELLDYLDANGYKKCIASSSKIKTIEQFLRLTNLSDRFDFYVSGEEVAHGKPAPDIFIEACNRAKIAPENAMVLEDSLNGLRAAKGAQIDCAIIPDMVPAGEEMKATATHIVPTLKDVIAILE